MNHFKFTLAAGIMLCLCLTLQSGSAETHSPPGRPAVAPLISERYANDADGDRIDDQLFQRAQAAVAAEKAAATPTEKSRVNANAIEPVNVELIFKEPVTQQQIDNFASVGGEITYIYKAVSYGWNARIPLNKVPAVPAAVGATLVLLDEARLAKGGLYEATSAGRVRPVWASGFAGSVSGFEGDTNTTIAFIDTGLDDSVADLQGRGVFWNNYVTEESSPTPTDFFGHGTRVASVALGTGASSGSGPGPLSFVQNDDLTGVASGSFIPMPFELPSGSSTITMLATWTGGTSTTLRLTSYLKGTFGGSLVNYTPSITGVSPLTLTVSVTGDSSRVFTPQLRSNGSMSNFVVKCQVSNYPATPDGFNRLRGVAPGCQWAAAKALRANNTGLSTWINAAIDDLIFYRTEKNIKVINFSIYLFGDPGINISMRQKINTAVNNGIVFVGIAGNDGRNATAAQREIDDPNRAALALTLAAANDNNQLTDFTSVGFASPDSTPGQEEDYKPDLMAPGGSAYYTFMMAADSSYSDGPFPDQAANDYSCGRGTSEAAPYASGVAALVIQAMEQHGIQWDFNSSQHPRFVKMVLCATASESNLNRENNNLTLSPTLQRASTGPNGFPVGKDPYEGFGNINADAAVEAVTMTYTPGAIFTATNGSAPSDPRVWARSVNLVGGRNFRAILAVTDGDFDLYLYSATPGAHGTPVILASSAQAGANVSETIDFQPVSDQTALLVVKRIRGVGNNEASFSLQGDFTPIADFIADVTNGVAPLTVNFTNLSTGNATGYLWNFGDGDSSSSINTAHTYTNAGIYSVTLTAVGPGGTNTASKPAFIVVTNEPLPLVDFVAAPTIGLLPLTVFFTNLTTGATNYLWAFGDGQFSTDENPSNTYTNAGSFTVTLTATGPGGTTNVSRLQYILVTNLPPVAAFDASPLTGIAPLTVYFTNLSSAATDFAWDFGDGNTSANANPVYTYSSAGTYTVALAAINSGGTNTLVRAAYILVNATPLILSPSVNGDDFTFAFDTIAGKTYVIEFKDSLDDAAWQTLQTLPGDGGPITITNSITSVSQRFFRLNVH